jgi:hypothetical protein
MRRLALLLSAALLLAACGDAEEPTAATPTPTPTVTAPAEEPTPTPEPTVPDDEEPAPDEDEDATGATTSTAYLARSDDSGIWVEPVTVDLDAPTVAVARAAMELLVSGEAPNPNLETLAPAGTEVLEVDIDGDVLQVDLSDAVRQGNVGAAGEEAFAQQLAHTAAQFDGVERVQLLVEGEPVDELWGHVGWADPIEPDPWALSPITFETHAWGEEVPVGEVTVGGQANTFEATVELRLIGPNGDVLEDTFTTATSGSGERGVWEHTFYLETPVRWTIEAIEPDPSGGEGRAPFTTTLELRAG